MSDDAVWIERREGAGGPGLALAGHRLAVKDNIDVAGYGTTAGCPSFRYEPSRTATAVERLLAAGAAVAGKANLDQFATGLVGTRSPYGPVPNPRRPGWISGGSSSGSAAAVAAGTASLGVGTDTAGSGRVPAALCGLVGLKGTVGWVPTTGVVPACPSFDCTTIMATTVAEAATALTIMAGPDGIDPRARARPAGRPAPVARLGVLGDGALAECDDEIRSGYRAALRRAGACGFELVEVDLSPYVTAGGLLYGGAFLAERAWSVGRFLATEPTDADPAVAAIIGGAETSTAVDYAGDRHRLAELAMAAGVVWDSVDAVMTPTVPFHPTVDQVAADPIGCNGRLGRFVSGANLVDWCGAVVPIPDTDDPVPFGAQLLGPAWSDEAIWAAAATLGGEDGDPTAGSAGGGIELAVVGAHLRGQPLNHQLTSRGATYVRTARTAAAYRLVVLEGELPKPGLFRDGARAASVEVEVWRLDPLGFGQFVADVPPPLGIGTVELQDGSSVHGFLCESEPAAGAPDISSFGGWRSWLASR